MVDVIKTTVPHDSSLQASLADADFYDAYEAPLNDPVLGKTESELLLGIDDRHLDVRVSVMKSEQNGLSRYVVSTVVHIHNRLGHIYMGPVGRIHPLVIRAMMRRAGV
jgi:hypothetical protein